MVQLSHLYRITEKTIALTIWTFVSKIMSLLFSMLSRLVIAFLPGSKLLHCILMVVSIVSNFWFLLVFFHIFIFYFTILRRLVIFYVTKFQYYIWKRLTCIFASRLFFLLFIPFSSLLSPVLIIPLHL